MAPSLQYQNKASHREIHSGKACAGAVYDYIFNADNRPFTVMCCHGVTVKALEGRKTSAATDLAAHQTAASMDHSLSLICHSCVIQDNSNNPQTLVAYISSHIDPLGMEVRDGFKVDYKMRRFLSVTQHAVSELSVQSPQMGGDKRHLSDASFPFMEYDVESNDGSITHE
ncbi:uncharacterized protein ARMOST_07661 [Armillaria ostoyae]|uniref:Uncharacterized protein n=1 Tax=Armillaria ostoyae TaxID=47428 RepID=A0A284R6H4_ARMOS|nr:uncharacterized protein ARMOST_07661 [Armillaria ostoyae]